MSGFLERLRTGKVVVADGAIGSLLLDRGLHLGECPETFNLTHADLLEDIARGYADAGSEFVTANTFGGSPLKLARYGLDKRTEEVNRRGVEAVRRGVGARALVAGSCGPSGRMLKPYGDAEPGEVRAGFERQMRVLVDAGVDLICVETMTDLSEARLVIEAARAISDSIPVLATMTFDPTLRGYYTIMGVDVKSAAAGLADAGADVVGSNCGNGIDRMLEIAREFAVHAELPVLIQSNAGLPEIKEGRAVYPETPEFMAARVRDLMETGVAIIGGCCGTTPEHIRAIRAAVDSKSE